MAKEQKKKFGVNMSWGWRQVIWGGKIHVTAEENTGGLDFIVTAAFAGWGPASSPGLFWEF